MVFYLVKRNGKTKWDAVLYQIYTVNFDKLQRAELVFFWSHPVGKFIIMKLFVGKILNASKEVIWSFVFHLVFIVRTLVFFTNTSIWFHWECSTTDAMVTLTTRIVENVNLVEKNIALCLDMAKTFDTVTYERLLNILQHFWFIGTML